MCLLIIIAAVIIIAVFMMASVAFLAVLTIITGICLLANIYTYKKANALTLSKKECPKCKNNKLHFHYVPTNTQSNTYHIDTVNMSNTRTKVNTKKVATCDECGYGWDFYAEDDIRNAQSSAKSYLSLTIFVFILCIIGLILVATVLKTSG